MLALWLESVLRKLKALQFLKRIKQKSDPGFPASLFSKP
jgi:hypothetical protein